MPANARNTITYNACGKIQDREILIHILLICSIYCAALTCVLHLVALAPAHLHTQRLYTGAHCTQRDCTWGDGTQADCTQRDCPLGDCRWGNCIQGPCTRTAHSETVHGDCALCYACPIKQCNSSRQTRSKKSNATADVTMRMGAVHCPTWHQRPDGYLKTPQGGGPQ